MKALVVDDEPDVCQVVKDILEAEGFEVSTASTGSEAMQKLMQDDLSLLFVDVRLGGSISGVDLIKHYRFAPKRPKIFIISASTLEMLKPTLEHEGIADLVDKFLEKPSDLNPLVLMKFVKKLKTGA